MSAAPLTAADLQRFCSVDASRQNIMRPWGRGAWTYATNGHIIVRVPRLADVGENAIAVDAQRAFDDAPTPYMWLPVPECGKPPPLAECEFCQGLGAHSCSCGHAHTCKACKERKWSSRDQLAIGGAYFANRYIALIQGWEIAPTGLDTAAWLRCDEAVGLLMPMSKI